MSSAETAALIEAAVTAYRERDADGRILPPPAWWDLAPEALDELFAEQVMAREIERATDPAGESATVKAVMGMVGRWR
jgi:hypothetical protein